MSFPNYGPTYNLTMHNIILLIMFTSHKTGPGGDDRCDLNGVNAKYKRNNRYTEISHDGVNFSNIQYTLYVDKLSRGHIEVWSVFWR